MIILRNCKHRRSLKTEEMVCCVTKKRAVMRDVCLIFSFFNNIFIFIQIESLLSCIVTINYWLYPSCSTIYPWSYFKANSCTSHSPLLCSPRSLLVITSFISIFVSLLLFCYIHWLMYFLDSTYNWYTVYLSFSDISLSIMPSNFIHFAANKIWFFLMAE